MKTIKDMGITEIENLTYEEAKENAQEELTIKDHDCFIMDFGEYFGYSILVFKNKKHIYHANDYELHHHWLVKERGYEELRRYYIDELKNKLFTDAELLEPCRSYSEYERKNHFLRNYWIMRYDHISMFFMGSEVERKERKKLIDKEYPYFTWVCLSHVKSHDIVETADKYYNVLKQSFDSLQSDNNVFREMVRKSLANHEACITCDYTDALNALGLMFEELSEERQKIVKEELKKQIENYC